jgi:hypothetical protein
MLSIVVFLLAIVSVLASVWWACRSEPPDKTESTVS